MARRKKTNEEAAPQASKSKNWLWIIALIVITLFTFSQLHKHNFINWGDQKIIQENADIQQINVANLKSYFTTKYNGSYQPVAMLSFAINYQISELKPAAYHRSNLLLHFANVLLLFLLLKQLLAQVGAGRGYDKLRFAFFITLLFAIQSVQTEAVAWISARSILLGTFFVLSSFLAYWYHLKKRSIPLYIASILLFALAAFSSLQTLVYPLFLLIINYLHNKKYNFRKLLPFVAFALFALAISLAMPALHASERTFTEQFFISAFAYEQYFLKSIFPYGLSPHYAYPYGGFTWVHYSAPAFVLATWALAFWLRRRQKLIALGILFFTAGILPALFITDNDFVMAEHLVYMPALGVFVLLASLFNYLIIRFLKLKNYIFALAIIYLVLLSVMTFRRSKVWNNSIVLWADAFEKQPNSPYVINSIGELKEGLGKTKSSIGNYKKAVEIKPNFSKAHFNLGNALAITGDFQKAIEAYNHAISYDSLSVEYFSNRGNAKVSVRKYREAIQDFERAILLDSTYVKAYYNRGYTQMQMKDYEKAVQDFSTAIGLKENYLQAYTNRAMAKLHLKDYTGALQDCKRAILIDRKYANPYYISGLANIALGAHDVGCRELKMAVTLGFEAAKTDLEYYCGNKNIRIKQ